MKQFIKKQIGNIQKFSFAEMTSNSSGKTSGSGTAGLYIVFLGGLCFVLGCVDKVFIGKDIDVVTQSIIFTGIGATLLGYRKSKDNTELIEPTTDVINETTEETNEERP
jgi:hypothetical protein